MEMNNTMDRPITAPTATEIKAPSKEKKTDKPDIIKNRSKEQLEEDLAKLKEKEARIKKSIAAQAQKEKKAAKHEREHHMIVIGSHLEYLQGDNGYDKNGVGMNKEQVSDMVRLAKIGVRVEKAIGAKVKDLKGWSEYCEQFKGAIINAVQEKNSPR